MYRSRGSTCPSPPPGVRVSARVRVCGGPFSLLFAETLFPSAPAPHALEPLIGVGAIACGGGATWNGFGR